MTLSRSRRDSRSNVELYGLVLHPPVPRPKLRQVKTSSLLLAMMYGSFVTFESVQQWKQKENKKFYQCHHESPQSLCFNENDLEKKKTEVLDMGTIGKIVIVSSTQRKVVCKLSPLKIHWVYLNLKTQSNINFFSLFFFLYGRSLYLCKNVNVTLSLARKNYELQNSTKEVKVTLLRRSSQIKNLVKKKRLVTLF